MFQKKFLFLPFQLLHLLQQWSIGKSAGHEFQSFVDSIQVKHTDKELSEKLEILFNNKHEFNFSNIHTIGSSEPIVISNSIYQNYTLISIV